MSPSAATNADKDVAIVERQIKSLTRRLQRCDLEVSAATTLFRSALIQEQASTRSGNAGEIEHAQNSLAAREHELQDALTKRNEAADALAKAQDRLTQLNKLFETPHREESTSRPQDLPQIPPPPGLVPNEALRAVLEAQRTMLQAQTGALEAGVSADLVMAPHASSQATSFVICFYGL